MYKLHVKGCTIYNEHNQPVAICFGEGFAGEKLDGEGLAEYIMECINNHADPEKLVCFAFKWKDFKFTTLDKLNKTAAAKWQEVLKEFEQVQNEKD